MIENSDRECIPVKDIHDNETIIGQTYSINETHGFNLHAPIISNSIIGGAKMYISLNRRTKVTILGKFGASPKNGNVDFAYEIESNKFLYPVNFTASGNYYITIQFRDPVQYSLRADISYCDIIYEHEYGYECDADIVNLDNHKNAIVSFAMTSRFRYYRMNGFPHDIKEAFVNASIGSYRTLEITPFEFYLSVNELPYLSNESNAVYFDAKDCSLKAKQCQHIKTLIMEKDINKTYYLAVKFPDNVYGSRDFGLYNNSLCPDCSSHGKCMLNKEHGERYYCHCDNDYVGLACSFELMKPYVMAIIIVLGIFLLVGLILPPIIIFNRNKSIQSYEHLVSD